jgi:GTP cyclohydrolase II
MPDSIEFAVEQIRAGRPIIVVDDERRENEGDLTLADSSLDRLRLPPVTAVSEDPEHTACAVPVDAGDYGTTAQILVDLGIRSIRLLTSNPAKRAALGELGIPVSGREPLQVPAHPANISYLRTKRDRLGHLLADLDAEAAPMAVAATPTDRATP